MRRSHYAIAIIVAGLLARLAYVSWYPQQPVTFDADGYDRTALALAETWTYPETARATPLYPALLAGVYEAFGYSHLHARIVQAVLVTGTAVFVFLIARSLFGDIPAIIAAAIVSWYPGFFAYAGLLLTETLFTLLIAAFTWCVLNAWKEASPRWSIAAGVMLGVATLCRGESLGLVFPVAALFAWRHRSRAGYAAALVFVLATAVTLVPWTIRQYTSRDKGVVVTGGVGATLWLSTYQGDWLEWYADREPLRSLLDCNCTAEELDRLLLREAFRNVADAPVQYLWMSAKRFGRFWVGSHSSAVRGLEPSFRSAIADGDVALAAVKGAMLSMNLALLALAAAGIFMRRAEWRDWIPLVVVIAYVNLVHVGLFSTSRYQIPIIPLAAVFAACAGGRLVAGSRPERHYEDSVRRSPGAVRAAP